MIIAPTPANERERLDALLSYQVLDSASEKEFDDITRLAAEICGTPISIITLIDSNRQWFKSKVGLEASHTDREISFCGHAILNPDQTFIVEDATQDERFHDNPLVLDGTLRTYVGVPLVNPQGFALGALCVIDPRQNKLSDHQLKGLEMLANQVTKLLELRKINRQLVESHNLLSQRYRELEQFSSVVSHDIKSPLNNILLLSNMLREDYSGQLDANGNQMIQYIGDSAEQLKKLVDGILEHYKYDALDVSKREKIRLREFTKYIIGFLNVKGDFEFVLPDEKCRLLSNQMALGQILYNLIANAIKYNDKEKGIIEISLTLSDGENVISIKDNGMGIPKEHFGQVFEMFKTLGKTDRFNAKGTGIGLSTVNKLVAKLGGRIELESEPGMGTTFRVILPK